MTVDIYTVGLRKDMELKRPFEEPEGTVSSEYREDKQGSPQLNMNLLYVANSDTDQPEVSGRKCCRGGCGIWCKKYFWEGQKLDPAHERNLQGRSPDERTSLFKRLFTNDKRLIATCVPGLLIHFFWWGLMIKKSLWHLFVDKYFMSITMTFGSIIAGMTSEGGGAVAFPVMTLGFGISPSVARDFSMMIQSIGMTCAAATIFLMKVHIEWHAIIACSLGGMGGMIFGLHLVDPHLSPTQKKICFVSIWFSFASVLLLINRNPKRQTCDQVTNFSLWKALVLLVTGFFGGIFTSFAGSGLDVCSFSILTLLFRVSEKVATPTSVVLMAGNSIVGFYWRGVMMGDISHDAWQFLIVCIPFVVFGAPAGSAIGSHFHRLVLAALVIIVDIAALVGAYAILTLTPLMIGISVCIIIAGFSFFWIISYAGQKVANFSNTRMESTSVLVD